MSNWLRWLLWGGAIVFSAACWALGIVGIFYGLSVIFP